MEFLLPPFLPSLFCSLLCERGVCTAYTTFFFKGNRGVLFVGEW